MSFKTTNHLLFGNKDNELSSEFLDEFNSFLTMKTFSFYNDGEYVDYINNTLNVYSHVFKDKVELYKFYNNIIPKLTRKKITYIKKPKEETDLNSLEERKNREFY